MKKLITLLCFVLCSSISVAGEREEEYIREMYNLSIGLHHIKDGRVDDNRSVFYNYSNGKIKSLLNRDSKHHEKTGDVDCMGYVVMWQGQDFNVNAPLTYTSIGKDKVKVAIADTEWVEGRSVTYQVQCKGGGCEIVEVYEDGKPFTKWLDSCLKKNGF